MKQRVKDLMVKCVSFAVLILCLCSAADLTAPETTERDIYGFETYHVTEAGAICDKNGIIKGWIHADAIYDADWNIHGPRFEDSRGTKAVLKHYAKRRRPDETNGNDKREPADIQISGMRGP